MKTFGEMLAGLDGGDALVQKFGRETVEDSIAALAKSYQSAEQRVHGSVKPPGADASDEEWSSFMQKIGAPGSANEYQAPEGVDSSVAARAAEIASQAAMTQRQYERVVKQMDAETQARIEMQNKKKTELTESYGDVFGAAKARAMKAAAVLEEQGTKVEDVEANPQLFAALEQYGATMADDTQPLDTSIPGGNKPSQKELITAAETVRECLESGQMQKGSEKFGQANREYEKAMRIIIEAGYESAFDPRLMREFDPYLDFTPGQES